MKKILLILLLAISLLFTGCDALYDDCPQLPLKFMSANSGPLVVQDSNSQDVSRNPCPNGVDLNSHTKNYWREQGYTAGCIPLDEKYVKHITNGTWESPKEILLCRPGEFEGENKSIIYCDIDSTQANWFLPRQNIIPYIYKPLEPQGDIVKEQKKPVKKSFHNEYSNRGDFIRTVCGRNPDDIYAERDAKIEAQNKKAFNDLMNGPFS